MSIVSNSDFFLIAESFRVFFEKVIQSIKDPRGIVVKEWLKYKDQLMSKEATPASIYSYSQTLAINNELGKDQSEPQQLVKLKRQNSRQVEIKSPSNSAPADVYTPRRNLQRRNSHGTNSPSGFSTQNNTFEGALTQNTGQSATGAPSTAGQNNLYSPWNDNFSKKNESPTERVNLNQIQQMKGLNEIIGQTPQQSKLAEELGNSQKFLLQSIRFSIEKYKKDSTGLDLIHDRSFSTQTVLFDNKRKPFDRNGKRQDSKFFRELSIYSKKGPGNAGPSAPQTALSPDQKNFLMSQQQEFLNSNNATSNQVPEQVQTNNYAENVDYVKQKLQPTIATTTQAQTFNYSTGVGTATANIQTSVQHQTSFPASGNFTSIPSTYSPMVSPQIPSYSSKTYQSPTTNITSTHTESPLNNQDIDNIVQRILSDQKLKEQNQQSHLTSPDSAKFAYQTVPQVNTLSNQQDQLVQNILNKHKLQSGQFPAPSTTTFQTSTAYATTNTAIHFQAGGYPFQKPLDTYTQQSPKPADLSVKGFLGYTPSQPGK